MIDLIEDEAAGKVDSINQRLLALCRFLYIIKQNHSLNLQLPIMNTEEIIDAVSHLPIEERIKVADAVQQTINPIDPDVQEAWAEEAEQRLQRYLDGETEGIPGEEVMRKAKERLLSK
jgi:putative addiction module component (TIGR02574 family)